MEPISPKLLLEKWVDLFNKSDYQGLGDMYDENAINDQVANTPLNGKNEITQQFKIEFEKFNMVCIIEHINTDGRIGMLRWKDPLGLKGCGFFHFNNENKIVYQQGYFDKFSFLTQQGFTITTTK